MRIQVSRDSVAAGDDIESHDVEFDVDEQEKLADFIQSLVGVSYLASIGGGLATWAVRAGRRGAPLAIVAEQWQQPVLLVDQSTLVKAIGPDAELESALDPYGRT